MKATSLVAVLGLCLTGFAGSAMATPITYTTTLSGSNEAPPNGSAGTGSAMVIFDLAAHTLDISLAFTGLTSGTTASHIHCCTTVAGAGTAGVATQLPTFTLFPLSVTSGTYTHLFDTSLASTYNPAFVTANGGNVSTAEAALAAGLASDKAYLNIHTTNFPGGEIRGFLVPAAPVPEPAGLGLVGLMVGGAVELWRRRSAARA
jgi:hypothetical protein